MLSSRTAAAGFLFSTKKQPLKLKDCFLVRLVPASLAATATESASVSSAEALATIPVALLAINSAISVVIALGRLERQFLDVNSTFGALETEVGYISHLPLRTILIVHFSFRLIC